MDAPDDASICWLGLVHVVRCCFRFRLSGLMMRLVRRHGPHRISMENRRSGPNRFRELDRSADI